MNFILIDATTGELVKIGDQRSIHNEPTPVEITGLQEPHHRGSTGRVYVKAGEMTAGYYPNVVGAKFVRVIEFNSTGQAYDACQCDEDIINGDILIVRDENVVGVADTWPFAVTTQFGKFHTLADESNEANNKFRASINAAHAISKTLVN
jgi:hypothetical protein